MHGKLAIVNHLPQVVITGNKRAFLIPEKTFKDFIDGKKDFTNLDNWEEIIRSVMRDWLSFTRQNTFDGAL